MHSVSKSLVSWLKQLWRSVWFYPSLILLLLVALTIAGVSGTSEGIYYQSLYGSGQHDPNLLYGTPQPIRSDEWIFITQTTIAQKAAGYPLVNHNLNGGLNMSVVGDAPYKDWSTAFKPQNLSFFVMPFVNAFAFKWWLLLMATMVSCYFLVLRFVPGKRLVAALIGTGFGLSPFFLWWYQTATFGPVVYGILMLILGMRIINKEPVRFLSKKSYIWSAGVYAACLAYVLTAFAFIFYPPFQIAVALVVLAYLLGYLISKQTEKRKKLLSRETFAKLAVFAAAGAVAGCLVLAFIMTRHEVIDTVQNTVYPGQRVIEPGSTTYQYLMSSFMQIQLERPDRAAHYMTNQSASSNFMLLLPWLFIPACAVIWYEYRKKKAINWPLVGVQLVIILYFANMYIPAFPLLYKVTLLNKVPHPRLVMGLGFAGLLQLLLIIKSLNELKIKSQRQTTVALAYSALSFATLLAAGLVTRSKFPGFISSTWYITLLALVFAAIIFCFLAKRLLIGALLFFVFSAVSAYHVVPLYRGLGPLYNSQLNSAIDRVSSPNSKWVSLDNWPYENVAWFSNRESLSGIQLYPNLPFWQKLAGKQNDQIYNRYAHVIYTADPNQHELLHYVQKDLFRVKFDCSSPAKKYVDYALSERPYDLKCFKQVAEVHYPNLTFYLYKIDKASD